MSVADEERTFRLAATGRYIPIIPSNEGIGKPQTSCAYTGGNS
jgi:hypothetical protein